MQAFFILGAYVSCICNESPCNMQEHAGNAVFNRDICMFKSIICLIFVKSYNQSSTWHMFDIINVYQCSSISTKPMFNGHMFGNAQYLRCLLKRILTSHTGISLRVIMVVGISVRVGICLSRMYTTFMNKSDYESD